MHHLINEFRPHQVMTDIHCIKIIFLTIGERDFEGDADGSEKEEDSVHRKVQRAFREG